ncbi:MAG: SCO family protein [Acidobacteria bacterium]|nr:SCO family protein [Acidobacteriota bacterium]MBK8812528.1 SCO family protein [Acidobacteriota bacterium]
MRYIILLFSVSLLFSACQKPAPQKSDPANQKRYKLTGKVIAVDRAKKKATIEHDEIKDYMKAMTMDFPIHADWVWDDLKPGAEVRAELVVDETAPEPYWLENIGIISAPNPDAPVPVDDRFASVGKEVIDFTLTNQDGKKVSSRDFRGKAWAITFIYAQCPLPDYCIRMSTNFSDAAHQIKDSEFKDKIALLSVSFDPERDTPEKLRQYGQGYLGKDAKPDFSVWQLAVGTDKEIRPVADFFGLRYEVDANDKTQFNHSLRTALIGPDGKVVKVLSGNDWTPADLLRELRATLEKQ